MRYARLNFYQFQPEIPKGDFFPPCAATICSLPFSNLFFHDFSGVSPTTPKCRKDEICCIVKPKSSLEIDNSMELCSSDCNYTNTKLSGSVVYKTCMCTGRTSTYNLTLLLVRDKDPINSYTIYIYSHAHTSQIIDRSN